MRVGNTQHDPRPVRSGPREWHGQGIHTAPLLGNWRFRLPPKPPRRLMALSQVGLRRDVRD
jgi:hypothetical protein